MWAFLSYMRIHSTAGVVVNFMNSMCKKRGPLFCRLPTGIMFVTSERVQGGIRWKRTCSNSDIQLFIPVTSLALIPRFSPRIITLVPGGPSAGEMPVTTGGGLILSITLAWDKRRNYNSNFHLSV